MPDPWLRTPAGVKQLFEKVLKPTRRRMDSKPTRRRVDLLTSLHLRGVLTQQSEFVSWFRTLAPSRMNGGSFIRWSRRTIQSRTALGVQLSNCRMIGGGWKAAPATHSMGCANQENAAVRYDLTRCKNGGCQNHARRNFQPLFFVQWQWNG